MEYQFIEIFNWFSAWPSFNMRIWKFISLFQAIYIYKVGIYIYPWKFCCYLFLKISAESLDISPNQ